MCFVAAAAVVVIVVVVVVLITVDTDILSLNIYIARACVAPSFQRLPLNILSHPNDCLIAPHLFLVLFTFVVAERQFYFAEGRLCCCRLAG